jgi:GT2 family glycosyltransferase
MISDPLVSVVIINYNSNKYIWRCLDCLYAQTYSNIEIIVVDNCSNDGSSQELKKTADVNLIYYRFDENIGSSAANNYGIRKSSGEYILILNADVFLQDNYIEQSVDAFSKDNSIGTVTGKLLSDSSNTIIDTTGIVLYKEGVAHERGMGEQDIGQYDIEDYVVGACCAAAMYKREMLNDIRFNDEYYDEDYFAFVEDLDLSVCATLLGWKTLYTYKASAYHVRGGSTSSMSDFVLFLNLRNSELFFNKFLKDNKLFYIYHLALKAIRFFTVKSAIRKKIKNDLIELRVNRMRKHEYYCKRKNFKNILPYVNESYIFRRLVGK